MRLALDPPWSTDWITAEGRRKLAEAGIAPARAARRGRGRPGAAHARPRPAGPLHCPQCGSCDTEELSRFGATACKALWRCRACREPFDTSKEI